MHAGGDGRPRVRAARRYAKLPPTVTTEVPVGAGTGFVWDDKGHVVTNFHVVKGANQLAVTFQGVSKTYEAKLLGYDEDKDVAVLRVDKPDTRPIPLGKSSTLLVGQKVFAIGNPFGLDHTLTTGIVSGLGRELPSGNTGRPILGVIQTDAAINPGNSGGPLLDSRGRLIGVNTAIYSPSGASAGVGFALPVDNVKGIVEQIIQFGRVTRPVLGLVLAPDGALQQLIGENGRNAGVLVLGVPEGGPAARAGIVGTIRDTLRGDITLGDIIVRFNETEVKNSSDLYRALERVIPDIRSRVECEMIATPLTQRRFVKKLEGTYGPGVDMTRFNVYGANLPPGPTTGVPNLYATGDSTYPGIGVPAAAGSGFFTANSIVSVWKHMGMVLGLGWDKIGKNV